MTKAPLRSFWGWGGSRRLQRRCRVDRRVNAEDAKSAQHDGKGNVPADCSGEAEIERGQYSGNGANETENFFVVHSSKIDF